MGSAPPPVAAEAARLSAPPVLVVDLEPAREQRGRLRPDDLDAFGKARVARRRRIEGAQRAVHEAQRRAADVLGRHAVKRRRRGEGSDLGDRPPPS